MVQERRYQEKWKKIILFFEFTEIEEEEMEDLAAGNQQLDDEQTLTYPASKAASQPNLSLSLTERASSSRSSSTYSCFRTRDSLKICTYEGGRELAKTERRTSHTGH